MNAPDVGVVVAGAGMAGLAAALELQRRGNEVLVVDASDRPGGVMRTDHVSGYVVERGPNAFHVKAPMLAALREINADAQLLAASPASRKRFIYRDGSLCEVPMSPAALMRTPLLSTRGKLRLLAEPFIGLGESGGETVASFIGRRLGEEAVSGLVGPFLTGVYAGDENELGVESVFPELVDAERRSGSITLGMLKRRFGGGRIRGLRGSFSSMKGLGPFARYLAEQLAEPVVLESRVTGLRRDGEHWLVFISGPGGERRLRASKVVLAVSADQAAEILRGVDSDLSGSLEVIPYAPVVSVSLGVDPREVREKIGGFGLIVPRDAELSLLGCLFMSQLFPSRAPAGQELLQCLVGGVRSPEVIDMPDDTLFKQLHEDLDRVLGLGGELQKLAVTRWRRAIPQPRRDHATRLYYIRERVSRLPDFALAGSYLNGVGVSDTFESGLLAAAEVSPD
jgi:oxygen-dependent protoporphyrinogen oxidase